MARYLETAREANNVAKILHTMIPDEQKPEAACLIAKLVNLGIRCAPRAVQFTVRLNAVKESVKGLPVQVSMKVVESKDYPGRTFNALIVEPTK